MRAHWKYIILSLIIGWLAGTATTFYCVHHDRHHEWRPRPYGGWRQTLTRDLNLTSDQQTQVDAIFESSRHQMQAMRRSSRDKIRQILTLEQQKAFDAMSARMDARRRIKGPPPPPAE